MSSIPIAIAEDNTLALKSIVKKLGGSEIFDIVFTAFNGLELINKYEKQPVSLVLMDIEMPVMDGITATSRLKESYPESKVVILTTFDDDDKIFNAILAGASGYLLKDESAAVIQKSLMDIYNGGAAMSPGIALKTLRHIKTNSVAPNASETSGILSARETEILNGLKNALGYKQIAAALFISEGTVRKHIENIYRKLQVNNKVSAIRVASGNNWL